MSSQIAVRLSAELVAFIDGQVQTGVASSRAAVVARAVEREHRRVVAEGDAVILAAQPDDDLDGLARHAARVPLDDLD